jgi:uncharacterized protein (TIGR02246 family)
MKHQRNRFALALVACILASSACRGEAAAPASGAMQVVQRWATAFNESNVDGIVSLYAPDALFFGTGSKAIVSTPEDIRKYFDAGLQRDKPRGARLLDHSVKVLSDDVVLVTGLDRVSGTKDGNVYHADGRVTFVLERRGGNWQIVHFHRSALPAS